MYFTDIYRKIFLFTQNVMFFGVSYDTIVLIKEKEDSGPCL